VVRIHPGWQEINFQTCAFDANHRLNGRVWFPARPAVPSPSQKKEKRGCNFAGRTPVETVNVATVATAPWEKSGGALVDTRAHHRGLGRPPWLAPETRNVPIPQKGSAKKPDERGF